MDEVYVQSLIEWMDGPGGYREQFESHNPSGTKGPHTNDSGNTFPPPPPPHDFDPPPNG